MLLEAMRAEGMVRYGAPFATPSSSWDEVRRAQPALEARSDAQLYQSYRVEYKMRYSHEDMSETLLRHLIDKNGIECAPPSTSLHADAPRAGAAQTRARVCPRLAPAPPVLRAVAERVRAAGARPQPGGALRGCGDGRGASQLRGAPRPGPRRRAAVARQRGAWRGEALPARYREQRAQRHRRGQARLPGAGRDVGLRLVEAAGLRHLPHDPLEPRAAPPTRPPRGLLPDEGARSHRDRTEIAPWRTPAPPPACRPAERRPRVSPCSCPCCRSRRRR